MKQQLRKQQFKSLLLAVLTFVPLAASAQDIEINEKNFPDENFRKYLLEQSYGKDGVITEEEIGKVTSITLFSVLYNRNISSLKGIEYFTALTSLECNKNQLTELDLSKNTALYSLSCDNNQLTELNLPKNTALASLLCNNNKLSALDLSGRTTLVALECNNNQLSSLNVSGCTKLERIFCKGNRLTSLDVTGCTKLTFLYCEDNQLTSLDLKDCTDLYYLSCSNNDLTTLDASQHAELVNLICDTNHLTALDVSDCTKLYGLFCQNNQLATLDITGCTALYSLFCGSNWLTTLDITHCAALSYLSCMNNELTSLDLSKNEALTNLLCDNNQLTTLDLSRNASLDIVSCTNNKLTSLNLEDYTKLSVLYCYDNQLTELNVAGCTKLNSLLCYNNRLTSLDVTNCRSLMSLWCFSNQLKKKAMSAFIETLPTTKQSLYLINEASAWGGVEEGNVCTKSQVAAAKEKGWTVVNTGSQPYAGISETIEVTVPSTGYVAHVTVFDTDFTQTEGVTAYKVTEATTTHVGIEPIGNAAEGAAVILHGTAGSTYTLHYSYDDVSAHGDNLFKPGGDRTGNGSSIYTLSDDGNGVAGFRLLDYGVSVPRTEGYLEITASGTPAGFIPLKGAATNISAAMMDDHGTDAHTPVYNLAGQQVGTFGSIQGKKGIYIINGKKIVVK